METPNLDTLGAGFWCDSEQITSDETKLCHLDLRLCQEKWFRLDMFGRICSQKGLPSPGTGCSGQCWSHHCGTVHKTRGCGTWGCALGVSMVVGTALTAELDLRGLFQPQQFQDSATTALIPSAVETELPNHYVKNTVLLKIPCFLY